jgi:hypothetical protein
MPGRRSRPTEKLCPSLAEAFKNRLNLKMPAGAAFSPGHPPTRRRETSPAKNTHFNFTYEDDIKIKNKLVAGISRTFLSIQRNHQQASPIS